MYPGLDWENTLHGYYLFIGFSLHDQPCFPVCEYSPILMLVQAHPYVSRGLPLCEYRLNHHHVSIDSITLMSTDSPCS